MIRQGMGFDGPCNQNTIECNQKSKGSTLQSVESLRLDPLGLGYFRLTFPRHPA